MGMPIDPRTRGLTATVNGLCAAGWFAWARSDATASANLVSEVAAAAALLVALTGLTFAAARYDPPSAVATAVSPTTNDPDRCRRCGALSRPGRACWP